MMLYAVLDDRSASVIPRLASSQKRCPCAQMMISASAVSLLLFRLTHHEARRPRTGLASISTERCGSGTRSRLAVPQLYVRYTVSKTPHPKWSLSVASSANSLETDLDVFGCPVPGAGATSIPVSWLAQWVGEKGKRQYIHVVPACPQATAP